MKKAFIASLTGIVLVFGQAHARDSYDHVRFGVDVPYEPMQYRTPAGELTGFDIDLGNALCEQMGITCEWIEQQWDGIIPGLMARNYDAIMSSMTINEERRAQVLFSDAYFTPPSAWFGPVDTDIEMPSEESLAGRTLGVQRGTLQDSYATDFYGDVASVRRYSSVDDMLLDMESGRLDLVFVNYPVGKTTLLDSERGEYRVVGEMIREPYEYFGDGIAIAFRPRDEALAERFNEALAALKEDGTYDEIHDRYFTD
ncbi:transporter substrate-binding domain-containing protein [Billgrantia aerodenitrificans]|uniref:Transporter substrate-binding domain-containing protein n=1 Tax=Billgrantia aerodenitrificans TaxID=2733483 RepID=A0ABS9AUN3_9GAMM|nr:transporter substrate-binding domain-containing protein [Halomonas aerodenitrificans]MCE8025353.1 transporter substrate-binding domain-containing protein [Halomonas aerodenitrificans]